MGGTGNFDSGLLNFRALDFLRLLSVNLVQELK